MKINVFQRVKGFFRTTFLGGLIALLPLSLIILVIRWLLGLIENYLGPLVRLIANNDSKLYTFSLYVLAVAGVFLIFFSIGLIIKTRWGIFLKFQLEQKYLMKIPGYKIAKDTIAQFSGKNKSFFSEVVIVEPFNSGTLMTGFITDDQGEIITVFVPTGPNPTSGNIYHIPKDKVFRTSTNVDVGMKSIISCGAGSAEIFSEIKK